MKNENIVKAKRIRFGNTRSTIERNRRVLTMLADDKKPKEIAQELDMKLDTLRWAIEWMRNNNGYKTTTALVATAIRGNLI